MSITSRHRQVVIFGRPWQRSLAYSEGIESLKHVCGLIGAEKVIDIGDPISGDHRQRIFDLPFERCGILPPEKVSELMRTSIASFLCYPDALLTKSSIYAASCAHGTIPFVSSNCPDFLQQTELSEGRDYFSLRTSKLKTQLSDIQSLSTDLYERYQLRSSFAAAKQIFTAMSLLLN